MNIIAIDIGNTNIAIGLFLKGEEDFVKSISGNSEAELAKCLKSAWEKIPFAKGKDKKDRDGEIVVGSVKPAWTSLVRQIVKDTLKEGILLVGKDIPLPIDLSVEEPDKVGVDRVVAAAAAYAIVEDAVVVADFGTAVTIDLVDERGIFAGGVIFPGFDISAETLKRNTSLLPKVKVTRPESPYGTNTTEAINCGLYYSAVGALHEVVRRYAEKIGKWPHTVITGSAAKVISDDCDFIDSHVPHLVVKGIALAYRKSLEEKV